MEVTKEKGKLSVRYLVTATIVSGIFLNAISTAFFLAIGESVRESYQNLWMILFFLPPMVGLVQASLARKSTLVISTHGLNSDEVLGKLDSALTLNGYELMDKNEASIHYQYVGAFRTISSKAEKEVTVWLRKESLMVSLPYRLVSSIEPKLKYFEPQQEALSV